MGEEVNIKIVGIAEKNIVVNFVKPKEKGTLKRRGLDKGGYWE